MVALLLMIYLKIEIIVYQGEEIAGRYRNCPQSSRGGK
jgi:hypothetical protein